MAKGSCGYWTSVPEAAVLPGEAIAREKHLKGWLRVKKDELIATVNPDKKDLAEALGW